MEHCEAVALMDRDHAPQEFQIAILVFELEARGSQLNVENYHGPAE